MDALTSKKTSLLSLKEKLSVNEQKIRSQMGCVMTQLSEIEELISAQSALDEKVSALLSSAPPKSSAPQKKRGPKKLSEMTPEERAEHDARIAARSAARAAARTESDPVTETTSSAASVTGSDSEEKKKKAYKSWTPWAVENGASLPTISAARCACSNVHRCARFGPGMSGGQTARTASGSQSA
jgi:hypothetical protein